MRQAKITNYDAHIQCREVEGKKVVVGLIPFNKRSVNMNHWATNPAEEEFEVIDATAFNKTLGDKAEVRALFSHDDSKILGSTRSGTLVLRAIAEGLECTCELPDTQAGHDAWETIKRGDCTTMSFGFVPYDTYETGNETHLRSVQLLEVSFCVAFPAYPDTDSITELRSWAKANNVPFEVAITMVNSNKRSDNESHVGDPAQGHTEETSVQVENSEAENLLNATRSKASGLLALADCELI